MDTDLFFPFRRLEQSGSPRGGVLSDGPVTAQSRSLEILTRSVEKALLVSFWHSLPREHCGIMRLEHKEFL